MADKTFDPRFDPAFQRGYAEGEHGERAEASAPPIVPPESTLEPALWASTEHGTPDPQSQYVDDTGATAGAIAGDVATAAPASLARNPWLYVLWALGVVGLVTTVSALWWANSILYGNANGAIESYAIVSSVQSLAPGGFILGSVSLVGAVLLHGLSWMRKNQ